MRGGEGSVLVRTGAPWTLLARAESEVGHAVGDQLRLDLTAPCLRGVWSVDAWAAVVDLDRDETDRLGDGRCLAFSRQGQGGGARGHGGDADRRRRKQLAGAVHDSSFNLAIRGGSYGCRLGWSLPIGKRSLNDRKGEVGVGETIERSTEISIVKTSAYALRERTGRVWVRVSRFN